MHLLVLADERRVRRATDQNYPEGKFICGFNSAFVIKKKKKKRKGRKRKGGAHAGSGKRTGAGRARRLPKGIYEKDRRVEPRLDTVRVSARIGRDISRLCARLNARGKSARRKMQEGKGGQRENVAKGRSAAFTEL